MRSLILVFILITFPFITNAETKCPTQGLTEKSLAQKMDDLALALPKESDFKSKKTKAGELLELINCELERTKKFPLDSPYRWALADYHSILTDLFTASSCKNLEEKMIFNETHQGTYSEEPANTKNVDLIKKLAKGYCGSK